MNAARAVGWPEVSRMVRGAWIGDVTAAAEALWGFAGRLPVFTGDVLVAPSC
jgi:hypothetical protein